MMLTINDALRAEWLTDVDDNKQRVHKAVLVGSLDEHTVSQLRELSTIVFDEESYSEGDHFLIDVSAVTEVDHLGLAALVGIIVVLAAKAGSLGLILPYEHPVRHALRVTGLDKVFNIHETPDAADRIIFGLRPTSV
jgi:anti-anti-sigma factor